MILALSRSAADRELLGYGAMVAGLMPSVEIHCAHVMSGGPAETPEDVVQGLEAEIRPRFEGQAASERLRYHVLEGDRLDTLLEFAASKRADLMLLGHGDHRTGRRSLARRLAMKAPCSVWMAPQGSPASVKRILVPIDFSHRSADVLSVATSLAEAAGLDECLAVHVHFNKAAATYDEYEDIIVGEEERTFCIFIAPIDLHGVHVKPLFVEGASVARTITRVAAEQEADLIIMGTRGRSRSAAVLLGSETEQTMIETSVPVLAVKHFGARLRLLQILRDKRLRERNDERFT